MEIHALPASPPPFSPLGRRSFLTAATGGLLAGLSAEAARGQSTSSSAPPPAFVRRGLPGPFHRIIEPLAGTWTVDKQIYIAVGSPKSPATSRSMVCRREWFGGGKHLQDVTQGELAGGAYYRMGVLGFSTMDRRYEWATFDALNANAMLYTSQALQVPSQKIEMTGVFTDQGLLGEAYVGKLIAMRTTIDILGADRHVIDLYFTPAGEAERLIDRSNYVRA
jgi:hypothetical protein